MIKQVFERDELQRYVDAFSAKLDAPQLQDVTARAAAQVEGQGSADEKLRSALPADGVGPPSSGGKAADSVPFLAREPVVSLLQSSLEGALREQGVHDATPKHRGLLSQIVHTAESLLHPMRYGPTDDEWVIQIAKATLERLAAGNHAFNPLPAPTHEIADDARVVVVGDWGSGLPRAKAVAGFMAEEVAEARAHGREAHVVHLGDVYYSGTRDEYRRNVLADGMWPVTAAQAGEGVTSWSLNGNHDMYGGGFGYFETLLADERFAAQRSPDGAGTSFFQLSSPSWDFVGLDTAWDPDVLADGHFGVLEDPQAKFVASVAQQSQRKLMLLSHHQLFSVYDRSSADVGKTLAAKLAPTLDSSAVTAWLWGHEHRCMAFSDTRGVKFARCIGHGGLPVLMNHAAGDAVPKPGEWEERGFLEERDERWARFGFAILDLAGGRIDVRYRDDEGTTTRSEQIA
jgi:Calcineurin-like phosphoesterase